ncbi:sulfatase-like hydrolase/transferase [Thalassotalea sp. PLHSN55]|uniref:sulfatase-like hydrolase/transferase n=1 Tax=Thalassotalea sp. PLHSN55 TaxID=3435888 RepID=UPI003F82CCD9
MRYNNKNNPLIAASSQSINSQTITKKTITKKPLVKKLYTIVKRLIGSSVLASSMSFAAQPNILVISMDDALQEQFGAFGGTVSPSPTPTIDALAAQGMKFTNAHTVAANCNPSRNVMISGTYPHQNGVVGFRQVWKSPVPLLPKIMQQNGYITGLFGKATHATPYYPFDYWDVEGDEALTHDAGEFYHWASNAFAQAKDENKPFFYMINTHDPHRKFWGISNQLVVNESQTPVPSHIYANDDVVVPPSIPDIADVRLETQYYYSTLRRGDDFVKEMLQALDESGLSDDTIVIFYADHGWAMPFAKTNIWNASTRTPLIVRWPKSGQGIAPNSVNDDMVSVVDFLPTILDAANISIPQTSAGTSFKPLLLGESDNNVVRDKVFKTHYENSGGQRRPMRSVQTSQYDYIFNPWSNGTRVMKSTTQGTASFKAMELEGQTNPNVQARVDLYNLRTIEEFYDLDVDPYELNNLIDDPSYANVISSLKQDLKEWMIATNDPALAAFMNSDDPAYLENWMYQQQAEADLNKLYPQLKKNAVDPTTFFYPHHDYYNIAANGNLVVNAAQGVTSNDYDAVGATGMQVSTLTQPQNGNLTFNSDGSFVYTPNAGYSGTDVFSYQVNSIGTSDTGQAKVYISVAGNSSKDVIFSDIFEYNDLAGNGWTNTGLGSIALLSGAAFTGNNGVRVKKGAKLTKSFSTLDKQNVQLHYSRRTNDLAGNVNLTVQWSADNVNWHTLETTQDNNWEIKTFTLPSAADDQENITIRFNTNGTTNVERAEIDNVSVTAQRPQVGPQVELVLLDNNFESNSLEGWQNVAALGTVEVAGEAGYMSQFGARIKRGAIMEKTTAVQGYRKFELSYTRQALALAADERLEVLWSSDGNTWQHLETVNTTSAPSEANFIFTTESVNEIKVRFAVYSNKNVEKALVDNIKITGLPLN